MDELTASGKRCSGELFLQRVLDRLDVVVGDGLDFLHALCVGKGEVFDESVKKGLFGIRERGKLGDARLGAQLLEPGDFHGEAPFDESVLGENLT